MSRDLRGTLTCSGLVPSMQYVVIGSLLGICVHTDCSSRQFTGHPSPRPISHFHLLGPLCHQSRLGGWEYWVLMHQFQVSQHSTNPCIHIKNVVLLMLTFTPSLSGLLNREMLTFLRQHLAYRCCFVLMLKLPGLIGFELPLQEDPLFTDNMVFLHTLVAKQGRVTHSTHRIKWNVLLPR